MNKQSSLDCFLAPWKQIIDSAPQILVGVSGGMDSMLLLTLLREQVDPQRIKAIHINHGLSASADQWQTLVAEYCDQIGVSFYAQKVVVTASGDGVEAAAREARYAVFERLLEKGGLLILAHHGDDQVETVLYRLLRGAGSKGLAGIPASRPLSEGTLIRPFLDFRKKDLEREAQDRGLQWIEDESNSDNSFDRNYLRNKVIPLLSGRWSEYAQSVTRSAVLSGQADQLSKDLAIEDLHSLDSREERAGWSISIASIKSLTKLRQKNILRYWSEIHGLSAPGPKIIDEILSSVLEARADASPQVIWQSQCWGRFQERLYLLKRGSAEIQHQPLEWDLQSSVRLSDGSELQREVCEGRGITAEIDTVQVRYRRGGERCKPIGRNHSNSLKKLLQEYQLPPWLRDRVPLLYVEDQLIAVGDLWICEGWGAGAGEKGLNITWQVDSL
jgi:tRNA(Ile)-lysidine synthase